MNIFILSLSVIFCVCFCSRRIINGRNALPGEYPFVVSIQWKKIFKQRCGGVIVNKFFILTACHCLRSFDQHVKYGAPVDLSSLFLTAGTRTRMGVNRGQKRDIETAFTHPGCKLELKVVITDIALAKITVPFRFNYYVRPAKFGELDPSKMKVILESYMDQFAKECQVPGWGLTSDENNQSFSIEMKVVDVKLNYWNNCIFSNCDFHAFACIEPNTFVCASGINDGSVWNGDSGGPLICAGYVFGIVSTGQGSIYYERSPVIYQTLYTFTDFFGKLLNSLF